MQKWLAVDILTGPFSVKHHSVEIVRMAYIIDSIFYGFYRVLQMVIKEAPVEEDLTLVYYV